MGGDTVDAQVAANELLPESRPFHHVGDDDLKQVIHVAADVGGLDDLRQCLDRGFESRLLVRTMPFERHLDEKNQADVQPEPIEPCMVALDADDTTTLSNTREKGAGGDRTAV